jgi:3-oxoacyl-[acyl-carrier protein] reductase
MKKIEDKIAVITGAARGIGFSIAQRFALEGAIVILIDLNQQDIDNAVQEIDDAGYRAVGYAGNVVDADRMTEIFKDIFERFGSIDILINNAGITRDGLIMKMKESDWEAVIDVNLKGTFNCIQKVCRYMMKQRSGSIINISSVIGIMGNAGQANYAASKAGIIALSKSAAKEFASRNIRVNAIAPGFIRTEMTDILPADVVEKYAAAIPMQKMGIPDDVARLCIFLASEDAGYITGQTINVDGGLIMQ